MTQVRDFPGKRGFPRVVWSRASCPWLDAVETLLGQPGQGAFGGSASGSDPALALPSRVPGWGAWPRCASVASVKQDPSMGQRRSVGTLGAGPAPPNGRSAGPRIVPHPLQAQGESWPFPPSGGACIPRLVRGPSSVPKASSAAYAPGCYLSQIPSLRSCKDP